MATMENGAPDWQKCPAEEMLLPLTMLLVRYCNCNCNCTEEIAQSYPSCGLTFLNIIVYSAVIVLGFLKYLKSKWYSLKFHFIFFLAFAGIRLKVMIASLMMMQCRPA